MAEDNPGRALVRLRWAKTTRRERHLLGQRLAEARWTAYRAMLEAARLAEAGETALRRSGGENRPPERPVDPKD